MVPSTDQLFDPRTLLVIGALAAVVLVAAAFLFARGMGRRSRAQPKIGAHPRRLTLVESLHLDADRRLLILRRDEVEHLVLVGGTSDLVVETGIERAGRAPRSDFPVFRGTRTEPEEPRGSRASPALAEEPVLVQEPGSLPPVRSADSSASHGAMRGTPPVVEPPVHAPFRVAPSPGASEARIASPVPPRRTPPSSAATAGRFVPHRAPPFPPTRPPPTRPPPTADPTREVAPAAPQRSLATPVLRSTPPASVREPDLVEAPASAPATGAGIGGVAVPPPDEPDAAGSVARTDPGPEPALPDAGETIDRPLDHVHDFGPNRSKVMNVIDSKSLERDAGGKPASPFPHPALEPQLPAETEASGDRDQIDRLEAEIARLLGRAPAN